MDFVNKAYAQAAELFRSLSPATRIAAGLLLAVVVVSVAYLFQYQVTSGDEYLLDGRPFSASEMTSIEAAFARAGLGGSTVIGNRIRIPHGQKAAYLAAMADGSALPADFYKYLDDAVASDNPFASNRSLELKQSNAKMKELALILGRMQGIESATVQFDEEARPGLARSKQKTAMVAVWTTGGTLEDSQVKAIRNVVASAYAGLDKHSITITDMTSHLTFGGTVGPSGIPEGENVYASYKLQYERDWQRKISDQLSMIPGVKVGVNVEMNPEVQHSTQSVKLDPKPVALSSTESSKETTTQMPLHGGRPGALPNGVGNQPQAVASTGAGSGESTSNESRSDQKNIAGHEQLVSTYAPLAPKKVTAAIDVPSSYYAKVWGERNPAPAGQQPKPPDAAAVAQIETEVRKRIQETVRNLLPPVVEGTDPYPHITVSTYTDLPGRTPTAPTFAAQAGTWLADNWRTVALVVLGGFCLLMVRSMVRSTAGVPSPSPAAAHAAHAPRLAAATEPDEPEMEPAAALRKRFSSSGPDLRAELHELVKENPDAAANVLRMWIGDAA
jgi:flagellar M-ring protein FliF